MTTWFKCDLQVATPAWSFDLPTDRAFDFAVEDDRAAFADRYMEALKTRGIQVIALADHNSFEWIDTMLAAGARHGIAVFPGCEVTTGTGADGVHVVVVGDRTLDGAAFDRLLVSPLGYEGPDNPRFHARDTGRVPGSSRKTLVQILEDLGDDYLVIAPHVLNDNGLASAATAQGDIRWKALHHHRLNAVDPGDCSNLEGDTAWNNRFRKRDLTDFPRLRDLAFVSTSDAYSLGELGSRFTWIRMEEPTLEALRQAFLDPEARILCDWDPRLAEYPDRDPNRVTHGWIRRVELHAPLGNSTRALSVEFDPRLNVLIGGRGSGKSTVIAALRQIYSGTSTLPNGVRAEAEKFAKEVFAEADLTATHLLPNSQEVQVARFTQRTGSTTAVNGVTVPTSFRVRVVNQKELFARVSHDRDDPSGPSRSLLGFADEGLNLLRIEPLPADSWWRRFEQTQSDWMSVARQYRLVQDDVAQLAATRARIAELETQVEAFDAPEMRARREHNDRILADDSRLASYQQEFEELLATVEADVTPPDGRPPAPDALGQGAQIVALDVAFRESVQGAVDATRDAIANWRDVVGRGEWGTAVAAAAADSATYLEELRAAGIDPNAYGDVRTQLARLRVVERNLLQKEAQLASTLIRKTTAWDALLNALDDRRRARRDLLTAVEGRSGRLKFELRKQRDRSGWANVVRDLLNLRSDAFLEDVPRLAEWLWADDQNDDRWRKWREALIAGDLSDLALLPDYPIRAAWQRRLEQLDETLRLRLAAEIPDDTLHMQFLKDGGVATRDTDWQNITEGSPGQRTAAMLAFVLNHGVEPLVLDQPEDDLDTEWISLLVVRELRASRSKRQIVVASHNANIPVNGDAERVIVLENDNGAIQVRQSTAAGGIRDHTGPIEVQAVRADIQNIMEGGIRAFVQREKKYNNEVRETAGWFEAQRRL